MNHLRYLPFGNIPVRGVGQEGMCQTKLLVFTFQVLQFCMCANHLLPLPFIGISQARDLLTEALSFTEKSVEVLL